MALHRDPTKHHYIPEFLLRRWTGEDGKLERFDRPIPTKIMVRRVSPSETGFEKNLYASPGHPLGAQWLEKRFFGDIDNRAAPVLEKLNIGAVPTLSAEERSAWSVFLRSLMHRTPAYLRSTLATARAYYERSVEGLRKDYADKRRDSDPASFDEFRSSISDQDIAHTAQRMLTDIIYNKKIGQFLNNMPAVVIELPDSANDFLISDDPFVRTNGIKTDRGHIAIPISPRRLFVSASHEVLQVIRGFTPKELATNVNTWVVESGRFFVGARDRSQDRFIRNRFSCNLKPPLLRPEHADAAPESIAGNQLGGVS